MSRIPDSLAANARKTIADAKAADLMDDRATIAALGQVIATAEVLLETAESGDES